MVKYTYDAWGNVTTKAESGYETLANTNPFRYRNYFYDTDTGLYYLKSRYYDPSIGRFVSQDDESYLDTDTINGLNLYAYCLNNPVMRLDPSGQLSFEWVRKNAPWILKLMDWSISNGKRMLDSFSNHGYFLGYDIGNYREIRGNGWVSATFNNFKDRTYFHFLTFENEFSVNVVD